jgi:hypothetical protein
MRRFKIGEKVVALNSSTHEKAQPRVKGKIYTVTMIMNCQLCGEELINVNNNPSITNVLECECKHTMNNFHRAFTFGKFFAPIDELDILIEQCVEDENYEDAQLFTEVLETTFIEK